MRQDAQKPVRKFCRSKEGKNSETHPVWAEKGETGCVLGAREGCSRYGRVGKPEIRTKMHQIAMQHMKKGNRRKPMFPPVLRQGQKDLVTPAAPGAAPQWGAPSTSRGGSRDRRGRAPPRLARPSARDFGVDVGTAYREWGSAGVGRFRPKSERGRVVAAGPPSAPTIRVFCQSRRDMPGVRK